MAAVLDHIAVGSDNGEFLGGCLHTGGIKGAVKTIWYWYRSVSWMIWQQQRKRHQRVAFFFCLHNTRRHLIKPAIVTDNKIGYSKVNDMSLHSYSQCWQYLLAGIVMADEKTGF